MPGVLSIFVLLTSRSEGANRLKIETLAHRAFGLLGGTSFSDGNMASLKLVPMKNLQGCCSQFGSGHGDKPISA